MNEIDQAITSKGGELPPSRQDVVNAEQSRLITMIQCFMASHINKMRQEHCEGCQHQWPSQRDHTCLMESPQYHVINHFDKALNLITKEVLSTIYAFHQRTLPSIDIPSFKDTKKHVIRGGLEDMVDCESDNEVNVEYARFRETMKLFL